MSGQKLWCLVAVAVMAVVVSSGGLQAKDKGSDLTPMEQLGEKLFFDKISDPSSMACSECHAPSVGWTGPIAGINVHGAVYRGAVPQRFGNRKPPSAAYATLSPLFHFDTEEGIFVGGNFWDGRATGWELDNPAADQAQAPFLNPVEQNNPSEQAVCEHVAGSKYAALFEAVWEEGSLDCSEPAVATTYDSIALSIAAYENSPAVNAFSSKYDAYLAGKAELTDQEASGLDLFEGKAMCANCHPTGDAEGPPLLTDFTYDNLGVPRNPENPFYRMDRVYLDDGTPINPQGSAWVDVGLGGFLQSLAAQDAWRTLPYVTNVGTLSSEDLEDLAAANKGKHKVPTLRNVAKRPGESFPKAYGHNGYFKSLWSIVHFYNTRDVKDRCPDPFTLEKEALAQDCWPAPEVPVNVNHDELGNLGLSHEEEMALVSFMHTLSDGWTP